jgi:hypothetical protein
MVRSFSHHSCAKPWATPLVSWAASTMKPSNGHGGSYTPTGGPNAPTAGSVIWGGRKASDAHEGGRLPLALTVNERSVTDRRYEDG